MVSVQVVLTWQVGTLRIAVAGVAVAVTVILPVAWREVWLRHNHILHGFCRAESNVQKVYLIAHAVIHISSLPSGATVKIVTLDVEKLKLLNNYELCVLHAVRRVKSSNRTACQDWRHCNVASSYDGD